MSESESESDHSGLYDLFDIDEYKDFITELKDGFPMIIEKIFEYLTPRQLCVIPCVAKSWGAALVQSPLARKRRNNYLRKVRKLRRSVGQENWPIKKKTPVTSDRRDALSDIRNVYRTRKPKTNRTLSHHSLQTQVQTPNTRQQERERHLRAMR